MDHLEPEPRRAPSPSPLRPEAWLWAREHPDLVALALQAFGSEEAAQRWFFSVHPEWEQLPAYALRTPEGAAKISKTLRHILNLPSP